MILQYQNRSLGCSCAHVHMCAHACTSVCNSVARALVRRCTSSQKCTCMVLCISQMHACMHVYMSARSLACDPTLHDVAAPPRHCSCPAVLRASAFSSETEQHVRQSSHGKICSASRFSMPIILQQTGKPIEFPSCMCFARRCQMNKR